MPGWRGLAASLVLLLLTAFAAVPEAQPAGDPPAAAPPFGHEFPDATAGAALQARLGNPRLAAPDRAIEREAFELLATQGDALVASYVERYGRSVNTDDARELFPAYRADRSRAGLVQRPATELSERVYARLLDAGRGKGGTVIFLAGGSGSGKTTALRRMMRERPLDDAITFDGTFADHAADLRRIRQALNQGYEISVVYVHVEDPLRALGNALARAEQMAAELGSGRTIRATELVALHAKARRAFVMVAEEMEGDPRVGFTVIDNSGEAGEVRPSLEDEAAVAFMRQRQLADIEVERLAREADALVTEKFRRGEISEQTYRGFAGDF